MKLAVTEFISADGVFEDPGGAEGYKYGGWSFDFSTDASQKFKVEELMSTDALLLGSVTYEGFAKAWPSMTNEFADRMNSIPKYVVSTSLKDPAWNNTTVISDNVVEEVAKLKKQPGQDLVIHGSGTLIRSLMATEGLIDEFRLMVHPIVLGEGKRLFDGAPKTTLELKESRDLGSGTLLLIYQPGKQKT